ncbi:hypothetical protein [Nocardia carnea]|uniref:hypothetical protein n=1 Tax=Nocardia carnea TaxID=37328 RepID=UPI0024560D71|nr:hypothetical protein [Nocardia carnea]
MRPRLVVLAPTVAGVVRAAGGWLFDRVSAGWEVIVLVADHTESRPLEILGVRVDDLEAGMTAQWRGLIPHALALDIELWATDARVRDGLSRVLAHCLADEVTFWGPGLPSDFGRPVDSVLHRPSAAARVFKTQALVAVGSSFAGDPVERFYCCGRLSGRGTRDLVPMS